MNIEINMEDIILLKRSDYDLRHGITADTKDNKGVERMKKLREEKEKKRKHIDEILSDPTSPESIRLRALQKAGVDIYAVDLPGEQRTQDNSRQKGDSNNIVIYRPDEVESNKKKPRKKKKKQKRKNSDHQYSTRMSTNTPASKLIGDVGYERKVDLREYFSTPRELEEDDEELMRQNYWRD